MLVCVVLKTGIQVVKHMFIVKIYSSSAKVIHFIPYSKFKRYVEDFLNKLIDVEYYVNRSDEFEYVSTLLHNRTNLDIRVQKYIFMGCKLSTKVFLLFDLHLRNTLISRNSIFYGYKFPYVNFLISLWGVLCLHQFSYTSTYTL